MKFNPIPTLATNILNPRLWVLILLCLGFNSSVQAQCDPGTDSVVINLTGKPDSVWNSVSLGRNGQCCTYPNNYTCIRFILTLDPGTDGIKFEVPTGAGAFGSLDWRINCGTPHSIGEQICLTGVGPHTIIFCKPGGNTNTFRITANPKPDIAGKLLINQACRGFLKASGLIDSTIRWESIPNDSTLNSFLSCRSGCDSVSITPTGNFPEFVSYKVTGKVEGACSVTIFTDTATVHFVSNIDVDIQPKNAAICFGGAPASLTANPVGGLAPFHYTWSNGATTQSISVSTPGTYFVSMLDSLGCTIARDTVVVIQFSLPIEALPGNDTTMCSKAPFIHLQGQIQAAPGGIWIGGSGTYLPSNTSLALNYYPSTAERNAGIINLKLVTTGNGTCPPDTEAIVITINPTPAPIITGPATVCAYKTVTYATNKTIGNTYLWNVTGGNILGVNNDTVVTVRWNASGPGTISVLQTNTFACDSLVSRNITINPTPAPVINGRDSVCEYKMGTYTTNKTAGNTYLWTITGGSILGVNNDTFITVLWDATGAGSISIKQTNTYSCDSTVSLNITISPTPAPLIVGPGTVCAFKTTVYHTYTTNSSFGNAYLWNITGGSIVGSNSDSVVTVLWDADGTGTISITQTNGLTCDSSVSTGITINPTPAPIINGPTAVCAYKTVTYSTNPTVDNTYSWSVTGGTVLSSLIDTFVTVSWGAAGAGTVSVTQINTFNCDSTFLANITINPTPAPVINGPTTTCAYKAYTYTTNKTIGNTYLWNVTGGTILSLNNDTFVTVRWNASGAGNISVLQTNTFLCDSSVSTNILINPTPAPVINGPLTVCAYKTTTYTTNKTNGITYLWNVTGGTILNTNTDTFVNVLWGTNGAGTVSVLHTNTFTCDSLASQNILINPTPAPVINGPTTTCAHKTYTYTTNKTAGNTYLWNVTGGTIFGVNNDTFITVRWNASGAGSVSIAQTNTFSCDSAVSKNILINPTPAPVINGPTPVCAYKTVTYSTNSAIGNTYLWNVTGGTILGVNNDSIVTVLWGTNGAGTISVLQANTFTCDSAVSKNILINPTPAPVINGPGTACAYKTYTYTTNSTAGNTYLWNVTGGTFLSSNTDTFVTVRWETSGTGTITILQTNTFSCDSSVSRSITLTPTPAPIMNGPDTVCAYKTVTYTTNKTVGNTYLWSVTGGTFLSANNDSFITVRWNASGAGNIRVLQTNTFLCDSAVSKNILINPTPAPVISGPATVCAYKTVTYTTNSTAGNTYLWNITGGTILAINNDTSISVRWGASGVGTIGVVQTNTFSCDSAVSRTITINPTPAPVINGPATTCAYKTYTYTTNKTAGNTYLWNVTGGTFLTSNTDTFVSVRWNASGTGTITILQTNLNSCDSLVSRTIIIDPTPAPVINGPGTVCAYKTATYTTNSTAGNTYLWNVTGGTILGVNNDSTVTVLWGINGAGNVSILQTNTFTCDSAVSKNIIITPTPAPVINGPGTACAYKTLTYTTNSTAGNTYLWNVTGGTLLTSNNDTFVTVRWDASGLGNITILQTNSFLCDSAVSRTITITPTPAPVINGPDTVCAYKTVVFTTNRNSGHTYLWNVTGGTILGAGNDTFVTIRWNASGTGNVSILQTNIFSCDSFVSKSIIINPTPAPVINGPGTVCAYKTTTYTTNATAGNTYLWNITGGTISGANNDTTVTVIWGINGGGSISISQTNSFSCDSAVSRAIIINPTPAPVINGPATVCAYKTYTYTTNKTAGNTYLWNVTGGTILAANNDTFVTVRWNANGTGNISVLQTNLFSCDSLVSRTITIDSTPAPIINGPGTVCAYKTTTYTTNTTAGNTYLWNVTGGTILGANNDSVITVRWGINGAGNVSVLQTNTYSCDSAVSRTIIINPTPAPVINGPAIVCAYKTVTYTTNATPGNTYLWNIVGGTILNTNNDTFVSVRWGIDGTGSVSITKTNALSCDSSVSKNILINPTPAPVINGPTTVCAYKTTTYTTNFTSGNTYLWDVTGGTILGANNDTIVTVRWNASGTGDIGIFQTNTYTCDSIVSKNITINPTPAPVITGPGTVCAHKTITYTTNATAGNTYVWNITGGTIQGVNNDTAVTVLWGINGAGTISVIQTNTFSCDSSVSKNITIDPTPAPVINGPDTVCAYKTVTYTTNKALGNIYLWNVIGGTIIGVNNDTFVTIRWNASGTGSGSITQTNTFTCDSTVSKNIIITPTPAPVISGPGTVCAHKTVTYTTNTTAGNTYVWNVTGGTIQGVNNDTAVTVVWGINGAGSIGILQTNSFGCDSSASRNITINPTPAPVLNGQPSVCANKTTVYTTNKNAGNTYLWNVTGGTLLSASNDTFIVVRWGVPGAGMVSITQTNPQSCDSTLSQNITINPTPAPVITGPINSCEYKTVVYSTNSSLGNSYLWNVTGGIIIGANNDSTVKVLWAANGTGSVSVSQLNSFGCDSTVSLNITINPTAVPVLNGPSNFCAYKTATYTTPNLTGYVYAWNVIGGTILGSFSDTIVSISWGASGTGTVFVTQTNSFGCDSTLSRSITIVPSPTPTISGPVQVCEYKTVTYSTNKVAGNTYLWNITGGTIVGANNDTFVTVKWNSTGAGSVSIKQTNTFTCDSTVFRNIIINPTPAPVINGPANVCEHKTITYTTNTTSGNTYLWNVTGGTILGVNNDTIVRVLWGTNGPGTIGISQTNSFGCDSSVIKNTTINMTPVPILTGPLTVCANKTTVYTTNKNAGNTYVWNIVGGTAQSANNDTFIVVRWGVTGIGSVSITQINPLSCDSTLSQIIPINPSPAPVITGPGAVCAFKTITYTTNPAAGNTYLWTITGGTILGANNDTTVTVRWNTNGTGSVSVLQTNTFTCDSTISKNIIIQPTPAPILNGPVSVCSSKVYVYSTNKNAGNTYLWTVTGGTILGISNDTFVAVRWGLTGTGGLSIKQTTALGCDSILSKTIIINPTPTPVMNGPANVCAFRTGTYTTPKTIGNTYLWTASGGTIVGANTDTFITVLWKGAGTGTITMMQTNSFTCDSTISKNVIIHPTPIASITGPDTTCERKTYTYSAPNVSGYTYLWTATNGVLIGANNSRFALVNWLVKGNGALTLKVTSASGCDTTYQFAAWIKPTPTPDISGANIICAYKQSTYTVRASGNNQHTWTAIGGTIQQIVADTQVRVKWGPAGIGKVIVRELNNLGCDSTDTLIINIKPTPTPVISGPVTVCEYKQYTYTTSKVTGDTYVWSVVGGIKTQVNDTTIKILWSGSGIGTVSLVETNIFTCDSTIAKNVVINPKPTPVISGPNMICAHKIAQYAVANSFGSVFQWSVNGGVIQGSNSQNSVTILWTTTGIGKVMITQSNLFGCDSSQTYNVDVKSTPIPKILGDSIACRGTTLYHYQTNNPTYRLTWNVNNDGLIQTGSGTQSIGVIWPSYGFNKVILTAVDTITSCDSTITKDIFVDSVMKPTLNANRFAGCIPLSVSFTGNQLIPGYTYQWDFGNGNFSNNLDPLYVFTQPGVFNTKLTVKNANGCKDSIMAKITTSDIPKAKFDIDFDRDRIFVNEDTIKFINRSIGGNRYIWNYGKGPIDSSDFQTKRVYSSPGYYTIGLTTIDTLTGCEDKTIRVIEVRVRENMYVPNAFTPNNDGINDYFSVSVLNITDFQITIFDRWGKILFQSKDLDFKWDGNYMGEPAQADVYGYLVEGIGYHGKRFEQSGNVTLLR